MKVKHRGFTLIEIMVVIVIAAILIGAVTISFPRSSDDLLKEEAERFSALVSLAQDEAILQSRDLGLAINDSGYAFFRQNNASWEAFSDTIFKARKLEGLLQHELFLEGVMIKLKSQQKATPQIAIYSSGEVTPFSYFLGVENKNSITIKVDAAGNIESVFKQNE